MLDTIRDFFEAGGIWSVLLVLLLVFMIGVLLVAILNPCFFSHLDGFMGQSFCHICGCQLRPYCPTCSVYHSPASSFCDNCGSPLVEVTDDD